MSIDAQLPRRGMDDAAEIVFGPVCAKKTLPFAKAQELKKGRNQKLFKYVNLLFRLFTLKTSRAHRIRDSTVVTHRLRRKK